MKITEKDAREFVRTAYELFGTPGEKINLEGARKVANWLYNNAGFSCTTLFVERVWNEITEERNG